MSIFQAVLFDLDGTLVDSEPRSRAAWAKLFHTHSVPCDAALLATFSGRRGHDVMAEHAHAFPAARSIDSLLEEAFGYYFGPDMPSIVAVPGAIELVSRLRETHVPMGIVSSGLRDHVQSILEGIGIAHHFDVLVTSDDVQHGKPSPEGYLKACAKLRIDPTRALAFEDAPAGIAAAKAAGMTCVALTTTQRLQALEHADAVVTDFTQIPWPLALP
ncbi:HAD family hydrolase [Pendulispora albinea]|uniref:HAD family phosphatase n=1 Tax=Pendulispora albinea TaxID=2741071 RepID=A0ABZ2LQB4_9BACT